VDMLWTRQGLGDGNQKIIRLLVDWRKALQKNVPVGRNPERSCGVIVLQLELHNNSYLLKMQTRLYKTEYRVEVVIISFAVDEKLGHDVRVQRRCFVDTRHKQPLHF